MRPRGPAKRPQRSEKSVALFNAAKGLEGLGIVEDCKSLNFVHEEAAKRPKRKRK